jgi:hypothetical protein
MQAHRRTADRLRAARTHVGELIRQHDLRIADPEFGMTDPAAGMRITSVASNRLLVERDRAGRVVHDQIRGHAMIALGDRPHAAGHDFLSRFGRALRIDAGAKK